jgi:hypothetical protein
MKDINGKQYPLWSQFVDRQAEWIGGILEDFGDSHDQRMFPDEYPAKTEIIGIELRPNGKDSAFFEIIGKDFDCGFDVHVGGIAGKEGGAEHWLTFSGYGGHEFRIKQNTAVQIIQEATK